MHKLESLKQGDDEQSGMGMRMTSWWIWSGDGDSQMVMGWGRRDSLVIGDRVSMGMVAIETGWDGKATWE